MGLPNWPDQLLEVINNAMALAVEEREGVGDRMVKCFGNANLDIEWSDKPGIFGLNIYACSLGLDGEDVDTDKPLLSLTIRPHVWWIDELKELNGKERAVAEGLRI